MAGSFTADLSAFVARAKGNIGVVVRVSVLNIGESIVAKTPVGDPTTWKMPAPKGYTGGRARGSWQYGFNAPTTADAHAIDGQGGRAEAPEAAIKGGASQSRIALGVAAAPVVGVHYITSNVPYMRPLEYEAHSSQAPEGMVRKTILEFQQHVADAVKDITP